MPSEIAYLRRSKSYVRRFEPSEIFSFTVVHATLAWYMQPTRVAADALFRILDVVAIRLSATAPKFFLLYHFSPYFPPIFSSPAAIPTKYSPYIPLSL
jgi:hypothetical protein